MFEFVSAADAVERDALLEAGLHHVMFERLDGTVEVVVPQATGVFGALLVGQQSAQSALLRP